MKTHFASSLAPNGQIYVNDLMQISSVNPRVDPTAQGMKDNIFAFGDVCLTSLNEEKNIVALKALAEYVFKNICQLASGQRPSN